MTQRTKKFMVRGQSKTFYSIGIWTDKPTATAVAAQLRKDLAYMRYPVKVTEAVPPTYRARGYYEIWIGAKLTPGEAFWAAAMGKH